VEFWGRGGAALASCDQVTKKKHPPARISPQKQERKAAAGDALTAATEEANGQRGKVLLLIYMRAEW